MPRRNILVIDDIPDYAQSVVKAISKYYNNRNNYDYKIISFSEDTHFQDAKKYILSNFTDIDIIFSDQKLSGGSGLELFGLLKSQIIIEQESITLYPHIFRVLHSSEYKRFSEYQSYFKMNFDYFVNSEEPNDIANFLNYYENKILSIRENGNKTYREALYQQTEKNNLLNKEVLRIHNTSIKYKNILFLIKDVTDPKSEYYFVFYDDGTCIRKSASKKISITPFKDLGFLTTRLKDRHSTGIKINPLWVSQLNQSESTIIIFQPYSIIYKVEAEIVNINSTLLDSTIDSFFQL